MADLAFDEASHTYRLEGRVVPSVTQVLDPLYDFSRVPPEVLERKRQLGTAVHKAVELDAMGALDETTVSAELAPYLSAWRDFQRASGFDVFVTEYRNASQRWGFAGTMDLVGALGRDRALVDVKTAALSSPVIGLQTAGYELLVPDELADGHRVRRFALHLTANGPRVVEHTSATDRSTFLAALTITKWRTEHGI
jgi:hypothetical protein